MQKATLNWTTRIILQIKPHMNNVTIYAPHLCSICQDILICSTRKGFRSSRKGLRSSRKGLRISRKGFRGVRKSFNNHYEYLVPGKVLAIRKIFCCLSTWKGFRSSSSNTFTLKEKFQSFHYYLSHFI